MPRRGAGGRRARLVGPLLGRDLCAGLFSALARALDLDDPEVVDRLTRNGG